MRCAVILSGFMAIAPMLLSSGAEAREAPPVRTAQAGAVHDPTQCYCRAQGRMFAVGESVCLRTAEGPRMAECEMVTNVTSWGLTARPCPDS
jgi:hypothetical protein